MQKGSNRFELRKEDIRKWTTNTLVFLAPLGVIYFGALAVTLQQPNHAYSLRDFVPSQFTTGAMVLYIVNVFYDLSRKWAGEH